MSLSNLNKILYKAQKEKYGILATVLFNFDFTQAVLSAAEEKRSPVVLMISEPLQEKNNYFNFKRLFEPVRKMAEDSAVPVCLHLDHGSSYESIRDYINAGLTSVMISGVSDLNKNIAEAKKICDFAQRHDVTVEGEVGMIEGEGGVEGNEDFRTSVDKIEKSYTRVEEANRFVNSTGVDCIAVSIGTSHGYFAEKPPLNLELISQLSEKIKEPLVIHGATGLSEAEYREIIKRGIVKLNYYTGLINAATVKTKISISKNNNISYTELNHRAMAAVKDKVKNLLDIFGSSGKA